VSNLGLLIIGVTIIFSGMLIQVEYHIGNHGIIPTNDIVLGFNYLGWSRIHKISIVAFTLFMMYHVHVHWKWYKAVITKKLFSKNQQVLILSFLFIVVAITGLTPWCIDLLNGDQVHRKILIEVHDKLAIFLAIFLILHGIRRVKWFFTTFEKIKKERQHHSLPSDVENNN
jgi:hypothetical protein